MIECPSQVYVVMGGTEGGLDYLSSTEQLTLGEKSWRPSAPLPRPLVRLRAATLNNIIYITGEMIVVILVIQILIQSQEERMTSSSLVTRSTSWTPRPRPG